MFRSRSWFGGSWNKPKNRLSLDHLKYLYGLLEKNSTVSESNRGLLVESLRCIAEILIWGDQHDSLVFDFFLEKNMLSFFLHIMRQKSGGSSYVCVQLLQTLNILFENIRNETSLYYLLSNNHVNSIIVHKFDFSDEDVMGYYILFLKTLSLKLNTHTIHFFYNENTNDFPLYTEAIKFFNHPESMVRIAVRTITLNVYKVENASMLRFIRDKTAAPYFSNLVWFIGKHILELDACVRTDMDNQSNQKLSNIVAEHLDHLHYLNDILLLKIDDLNAVLTEHLLQKLFVPLYIFSLTPAPPLSMAVVTQNLAAVLNKVVEIDIPELNNPRVSPVVALYLLSLVFLVITNGPLVHALAWVLLNADSKVFTEGAAEILNAYVQRREVVAPGFIKPRESLEMALDTIGTTSSLASTVENSDEVTEIIPQQSSEITAAEENLIGVTSLPTSNITDEEKESIKQLMETSPDMFHPFLDVVISSLDCLENDYLALLSLCLIYSMANNQGASKEWLDQVLSKHGKPSQTYKCILVESLLNILIAFNQPTSRIRLITLELTLELLVSFTKRNSVEYCITESQQNTLFLAQCQAMNALKNFYISEDIFLDLFEDEYQEMKKTVLNIEYLCMDSSILLPPTGTPLTGISFTRRLPCGEVEKARRAIRGYFLLRRTCQIFLNESETILPLIKAKNCVDVDNVLDLNNSDLIACTVILKDNTKQRRFLVIDTLQLILVEPDAKLLGWGVAKYVGFLQDVEVVGDKDDSRCLHITVHRGGSTQNRTPILSAKFLFDDHIRCMAAKQRLTKGRSKARQKKMYQIAQLLEIPTQLVESPLQASQRHKLGGLTRTSRNNTPIFSTTARVPGFASALKKDTIPIAGMSRIQMLQTIPSDGDRSKRRTSKSCSISPRPSSSIHDDSTNFEGNAYSRAISKKSSTRSSQSSPKICLPRSEDIPLEDFQHFGTSSQHSLNYSSNASSASQTPSKSTNNIPISHSTLQNVNEATIFSFINETAQSKEAVVTSSEETSFMSEEDKKRRRGRVENI